MLPLNIDPEIIKNLSEPMVKLIEAIRSTTGTFYEPTRIKKEAKAKAQAKVYEKIGELVCNEIEQRGLSFFIQQQGKKQLNIDNIIEKCLKQQLAIEVPDNNSQKNLADKYYSSDQKSKSDEMIEESWINDFFDLCQNSSEEQIQEIWAALLRMEVANPGTVSRRLMHSIKIMSSKEASTFEALANCSVEVKQGTLGVYDDDSKEDFNLFFGCVNVIGDTELYETGTGESAFGFNLHDIVVLEEIGLINRINFSAEENDAREVILNSEDKIYLNNAEFEMCDMTYLGLELLRLIAPKNNENYFETIKKDFTDRNMIFHQSR